MDAPLDAVPPEISAQSEAYFGSEKLEELALELENEAQSPSDQPDFAAQEEEGSTLLSSVVALFADAEVRQRVKARVAGADAASRWNIPRLEF